MIEQKIGLVAPVANRALKASALDPASERNGFSAIFDQINANFIEPIKAGEAAATAVMAGKMPVQEAVLKVMEAERALYTGIALRDKAVAAYQEIMRMNI